jgi:hypothetical protein
MIALAIENKGTTIINFSYAGNQKGEFVNQLKVYKRSKQACFECSAIIISKKIKPANGQIIFQFIYDFIYELYFSEKYASLRNKFKSEYGFNIDPHFINQSVKLADGAMEHIKVIYIQLIDNLFGEKYAEIFSNIIKTSDDNIIPFDDINLNILRTLYNFYNLIPTILKQLHRRHFGLQYNDIENVGVLYDTTKKKISLSKNYKLFIAVTFDSN